MIITVDRTNLLQATMIHSISWKESHRFVCVPDFVEMHTPERQQKYMQNKMNCGSKFYMLVEDIPVSYTHLQKCTNTHYLFLFFFHHVSPLSFLLTLSFPFLSLIPI